MTRLSLALVLLFGSTFRAVAIEHGPILQWHRDPTTTMGIQWIERGTWDGEEGQWTIGRAGFGYGDGDDTTIFFNMKGVYRSLYIRRAYALPAKVPAGAELQLEVKYDDGIVVYLDGKEVARRGVEGTGNTVQSVRSHEASEWERISLGPAVAGAKGVIAIEGHNDQLDSSDFSLHPRLVLRWPKGARPVVGERAAWEYLARSLPEEGWTKQTSLPPAIPWKPKTEYRLGYRRKGEGWTMVDVRPSQFGPSEHSVHTVDLDGLEPGTRYQFQIAKGNEPIGVYEFETAPASFRDGLSFVTGGDMFHDRQKLDAMNKRAGAEDPLFALLGGDLAYANGTVAERWFEWVDSWSRNVVAPDGRMIPMIVVIGNHEVQGYGFRPTDAPDQEAAPFYYSLFQGQESGGNFAVDFGNYLSILGLDSGHTGKIAAQTTWLDGALRERTKFPRQFVCYHRPAWGTGVKGDATDIQREWSPLFEKYQVDCVFENDHHVYKRTHPITGGKIDQEKGILYLGDGSWGVNTRLIRKDWQEKRPWLARAESLNHLIRVDMTAQGFHYRALKADGELIDETRRPLRRAR